MAWRIHIEPLNHEEVTVKHEAWRRTEKPLSRPAPRLLGAGAGAGVAGGGLGSAERNASGTVAVTP